MKNSYKVMTSLTLGLFAAVLIADSLKQENMSIVILFAVVSGLASTKATAMILSKKIKIQESTIAITIASAFLITLAVNGLPAAALFFAPLFIISLYKGALKNNYVFGHNE